MAKLFLNYVICNYCCFLTKSMTFEAVLMTQSHEILESLVSNVVYFVKMLHIEATCMNLITLLTTESHLRSFPLHKKIRCNNSFALKNKTKDSLP